MWTKRSDFGDVAVSFGLRNEGYTPEGESWDSVKRREGNAPDDEVRIQVVRQGEVVLEAIDPAGTCDVLRKPGRIGIRGDRTEFYVDGLDVRGLSAD